MNGRETHEVTELHHRDRVILGGNHVFRFIHPRQLERQREAGAAEGKAEAAEGAGEVQDWEFAVKEMTAHQMAALTEEERRKREEAEQVRGAAAGGRGQRSPACACARVRARGRARGRWRSA